jgi:hypothetical protein
MNQTILWALASALCLGAAFVAGCASDDAGIAPVAAVDAGKDGAKEAASDVATEAASDVDAGPVPQRVLVTMNNSKSS